MKLKIKIKFRAVADLTVSSGINKKNISHGNVHMKKLVQSKMCEKRKNGAECIRGIKIRS